MPYAPFPPTLDRRRSRGTVYSWALNNIWDTNFPPSSRARRRFRYAIASAAGVPAGRRLGSSAAAGLTDPLVAVLTTGSAAAPPVSELVTVDAPDVLITSVGRGRRGDDLVVRLQSMAADPVEAGLRAPG